MGRSEEVIARRERRWTTAPVYDRFLYGGWKVNFDCYINTIHRKFSWLLLLSLFFLSLPSLRTLLSFFFFLFISISICVPGTTPKRETIKLSNPPTMVIFQHSMSVKGGHFECRSSRVGIKKTKKKQKNESFFSSSSLKEKFFLSCV